MRPAVRFPSPGSGPPLVRSACPQESSPSRVAGFWLPAPPLPSAPRRWTPGSFPVRLPDVPKNAGTSPGLRPPFRVSDRPLRPTRFRIGSSREVRSPTTTTPADPVHPGLPHPAPSGLRVSDPLAGLLPASAPDPRIGCRPWGSPYRACPSDQPYPSPGRCSHAVSRLSLPSPLRTRRSGAPPRLQSLAPAEGPTLPGGRTPLPSRGPPGLPPPPKLSPHRDGAGFPAPPLMRFPTRSPKRPRWWRFRVSLDGEVR
jgi:hypothetical protein